MELDDLKGAWQQQTQTGKNLFNDNELLAMLRMKATSTIDLLKRNLRLELMFTALFLIACLAAVFITTDEKLRNILFITIIISSGFVIYYYKKLSLLNNLNVENKSIKENLNKFITQFEKFLRFYRLGYNILIPVALLAGAFVGNQVSTGKDLVQVITDIKLWAILIAVLIPVMLLFNYGMKWYLKNLYGKHITRLKTLLLQLQD